MEKLTFKDYLVFTAFYSFTTWLGVSLIDKFIFG